MQLWVFIFSAIFLEWVNAQQCISGQCGACTSCTVTAPLTCPLYTVTDSSATSLLNCTCIAGAFSETPNVGLECTLCSAGSYGSATGLTACTLCGAGTYLPGTGSSSSSDCLQCPAGTYFGGTGGTSIANCVNCAAGYYSGTLGAVSSATCQPCTVGFYSLTAGATNVSTCIPVPNGYYCSNVPCNVVPGICTNLPSNATYISPGTSPSNCQWACNPQYYKQSNSSTVCTACPADFWCTSNVANQCPLNSGSVALSSNQNQCICKPGFYGNGSKSPCIQCPAGSWCPGSNTNAPNTCPENSTSLPGAAGITQCQCLPGFYGENGTGCQLCPPNSICSSGQLSSCPANTQSLPGSSGLCTCNAGFYSLTSGGTCMTCPPNSWCEGDTHIASCTTKGISPARSVSSLACYCDKGYEGQNNSACVPCAAGTWCYMGHKERCPDNTTSPTLSSYIVNCSCIAGYTGPDGGPCSLCLQGTYKNNTGSNACTGCAANTYMPFFGSTSCLPTTNCPAGWWANPAYNAVSDNVCQRCPENYQCQANTRTICPPPSVSPVGSSSYLNCSCPAGTFGSVTGPAANAATCTPCSQGMYCPGTVCQCSR